MNEKDRELDRPTKVISMTPVLTSVEVDEDEVGVCQGCGGLGDENDLKASIEVMMRLATGQTMKLTWVLMLESEYPHRATAVALCANCIDKTRRMHEVFPSAAKMQVDEELSEVTIHAQHSFVTQIDADEWIVSTNAPDMRLTGQGKMESCGRSILRGSFDSEDAAIAAALEMTSAYEAAVAELEEQGCICGMCDDDKSEAPVVVTATSAAVN